MRDDSDKLDTGRGPAALDAQAAARRRLLLKSLGKGSAVVAAASPLASFAAPVMTTTGTQCTVSGFKSALASRVPASPLPCGGYGPKRFFTVGQGGVPQAANWPSLGGADPNTLTFRDLFGGIAPTSRVLDILANNAPPDLALFVAAYFTVALAAQGGALPPGRVALPLTTADVVQQYANGNYDQAVIEFYTLVLTAS